MMLTESTECDICKYPCEDKKGCEFGPSTANDLLPCPFCAGAASISQRRVFHDVAWGWRVECEGDCHGMTCWWHSRAEAVQNWNRRA